MMEMSTQTGCSGLQVSGGIILIMEIIERHKLIRYIFVVDEVSLL